MGQIEIYSGEDEEISAELSAGYDVLYDNLKDGYESEDDLNSDICRVIESVIIQEIQSQSDGSEIHELVAQIITNLEETGEIDIDSVVQNSIHTLAQSANQ